LMKMHHCFRILTAFVVVSTIVIGKWLSGNKWRNHCWNHIPNRCASSSAYIECLISRLKINIVLFQLFLHRVIPCQIEQRCQLCHH
jgi:hypothetical protein